MTIEDTDRKAGVLIKISGDALRAAMDLRAEREKGSTKPVSLAAIVRDAISAQHIMKMAEKERREKQKVTRIAEEGILQ
jgi:hypothetical protein